MTTPLPPVVPPNILASLADRYRVEREIGAGGMATVYLAQDLKHDRRVAIKVLHPELSAVLGAERFLTEIKTTAALQHPHILPLFDSGAADGLLFYVMPLVEGETLRARLAREKQLPIADAVRLTKEIASALDYAHRHGVIHRDIKPENILLHEGQGLVADFGIALAVQSAGGQRMTQTGLSLGTPQYMSPEQAMGEREITARSDVYALGAVAYEMLVGEPPFTGPTTQAIFAKVMTEQPRSLVAQRKSVPDMVDVAVLTALQKLPADRFNSAAEFAAALDGILASTQTLARGAAHRPPAWSRRARVGLALAAVAGLSLAFIAGRIGARGAPATAASFAQRTFDEHAIYNARFAPDGKTLVYSAAVGLVPEIFVIRPDYAEPQRLGLAQTHLLSVSSQNELAVLVRAQYIAQRLFLGTLARVPLGGGAPREMVDSIREADWSPDGTQLAVIRAVGGRDRLEFPIGKVLVESSGYLSDPRVSPDGKHIVFAEHPFRWDDRGTINVVDLAGKKRVLTPVAFAAEEGMAWSRTSDEVLFSAWSLSHGLVVHTVTLDGRLRESMSGPGHLTMHDVSPSGEWLITRDEMPTRVFGRAPGATEAADIGWLDNSSSPVISADGKLVAFANQTAAGGANYAVMLRKTDGGPAAQLGEGSAFAFSPDGKWVLAGVYSTPARLMIYPTGAGAERKLETGALESVSSGEWFSKSESVLVCGNEKSRATRCFTRALGGDAWRPVTPEATSNGHVSPDERWVLAETPAGARLFPLQGGESRAVTGSEPGDEILRWSPDGAAVWVRRQSSLKADRIELATGRRTPLLDAATTGHVMNWVFNLSVANDGRSYTYSGRQLVSHLFTAKPGT